MCRPNKLAPVFVEFLQWLFKSSHSLLSAVLHRAAAMPHTHTWYKHRLQRQTFTQWKRIGGKFSNRDGLNPPSLPLYRSVLEVGCLPVGVSSEKKRWHWIQMSCFGTFCCLMCAVVCVCTFGCVFMHVYVLSVCLYSRSIKSAVSLCVSVFMCDCMFPYMHIMCVTVFTFECHECFCL